MTTSDNVVVSRKEFDDLCKQVEDLSKKHPAPVKRTRAPSEFNLYVGDKIKEIRAKDPTLPHKEAFSKAVESWNKVKGKKK